MSRSRNTEKESVWAASRIGRNDEGEVRLPRIIARKPGRGDIHPLSKSVLAHALTAVPTEYIYGLSRVELRPRQGNKIGDPFGEYRPDERVIVLYSVPMSWVLDQMSPYLRGSLEVFGGAVSRKGKEWHVRWPSEKRLMIWFYSEVLTHELGHHFAEQYKKKRGAIKGVVFREMNANLHSSRLARALFTRVRKRLSQKKSGGGPTRKRTSE